MKDQRKRVAKRLASGLLAGALALGGLAISGGTASAKTPLSPSTNRISGADRYETAVAIARNMAAASDPSEGLVIASGETPYDALAASVLTTNKRPMLLVKKDSIPTAVADFLSDYKAVWTAGSPKVYVVGGENAISKAVLTAITSAVVTASDTTPPVISRISGDNRYATAKAIGAVAGITSAGDTMIIVNGEDGKWADSVSVAPLSAWAGWPVTTTTGASLSADAQAAVDAYLAIPGSEKKFLIVGGTASVSTAVEEYLTVTKAVPVANVRRVAGSDRYMTNVLFNLYITGVSAAGKADIWSGSEIALVSGESPWDALTAAAWAGTGAVGRHVVLTPSAGGNFYVDTLVGALADIAHGGLTVNTASLDAAAGSVPAGLNALVAGNVNGLGAINGSYGTSASAVALTASQEENRSVNLAAIALGGFNQIDKVWVVGGTSAVSNGAKTGYLAKANGDLTATMTCSAGSPYVSISLSGTLTPFEAMAFAGDLNVARFTLNGAALAAGSDIADDQTWVNQNSGNSYTLTLPDKLTATSSLKFLGWEERTTLIRSEGALVSHAARRSISSATCVPGADTVVPTVTAIRAVSGSAVASATNASQSVTHSILIKFSEPITIDGVRADGSIAANKAPVTVGATAVTQPVSFYYQNASRTQVVVKFANNDTAIHSIFGQPATGSLVATLNTTLFVDDAGNAIQSGLEASVLADSTKPVITSATTECVVESDKFLGRVETNSTMTAGSLVLVPAIAAYKGAKAAGWTLTVVNQRGLAAPKMAVDAAAKKVTVTVDSGYHVPADLATVLDNTLQSDSGFGGLVGGGWDVQSLALGAAGSIASTVKMTPTVTPAAAVGGTSVCALVLSGNEPFSVGNGLTVAVAGLSAGYTTELLNTGNNTSVTASHTQRAGQHQTHEWTQVVWFTTKILGTGTVVGANSNAGFTDVFGNITTEPIAFTVS